MSDPHAEWDLPQPEQTHHHRRAATALWLAAGINILLFGCCAAGLGLWVYELPPEVGQQLNEIAQEQQIELAQLEQALRIIAAVAAALVLILLFLPSLILIYLGFPVRDGRPKPMLLAIVILAIQAVSLGIVLLLQTIVGLFMAPFLGVVLNLLMLGLPLFLMIRAISRLRAARRYAVDPFQDEPWNQPFA